MLSYLNRLPIVKKQELRNNAGTRLIRETVQDQDFGVVLSEWALHYPIADSKRNG
jgi:hypothetical protein